MLVVSPLVSFKFEIRNFQILYLTIHLFTNLLLTGSPKLGGRELKVLYLWIDWPNLKKTELLQNRRQNLYSADNNN